MLFYKQPILYMLYITLNILKPSLTLFLYIAIFFTLKLFYVSSHVDSDLNLTEHDESQSVISTSLSH